MKAKLIDKALSRIEQIELTFQLEAIFEAFPDILFKLERDGTILSCKAGKATILQLNPEEYTGKNISELMDTGAMRRFRTAVSKLKEEGDVASFEFVYPKEDKECWFEVRLVPFYKNQLLAIVRDITEKKELSFIAARSNLTDALKEAFDGRDGETKSGFSITTVQKKYLTPKEELEQKINEYNQLNEKLNHEIMIRRGIESTLNLYINDLRKRNIELEHFHYLASNEFQEPLRAITSFARIFDRRYGQQLDKNAKEMLDYMVDGAETMQRIIYKLSDYVALDKAGLKLEYLSLELLLPRVLARLMKVNKLSNRAYIFLPESLPSFYGDRKQIELLLEQLLGNCIRFAQKDRPLHIQLLAVLEDKKLIITIKDNGIGFDDKFKDRIFMLFQRLHPGKAYDGAGIGLALCKKIVENHGGEITASGVPMEGACFRFSLLNLM